MIKSSILSGNTFKNSGATNFQFISQHFYGETSSSSSSKPASLGSSDPQNQFALDGSDPQNQLALDGSDLQN